MRGLAVERERFDGAMRDVQDGAARRLIDAARLHADETVLDQIEPADAIVLAERRLSAVRSVAGDIALPSIATGSPFRNSISIDGRPCRAHPRARWCADRHRRRLDPRIFQHLAFRGGVQEIGIDREGRLAALVLGDLDLVLLGEVDQVGAAT